MIFAGGLSVLSLLPAVTVAPVANFLPRVEQHGAAPRSDLHLATLPFSVSLEAYQDRSDFLNTQEKRYA